MYKDRLLLLPTSLGVLLAKSASRSHATSATAAIRIYSTDIPGFPTGAGRATSPTKLHPTLVISGDAGGAVETALAGCEEIADAVLDVVGVVVAVPLVITCAL